MPTKRSTAPHLVEPELKYITDATFKSFHGAIARGFQDFSRDQRHGFRIIQFHTTGLTLSRQLGGDKYHELFLLARGEMQTFLRKLNRSCEGLRQPPRRAPAWRRAKK